MIDFNNSIIQRVILHTVGNKTNEGQLILNAKEIELTDSITDFLITYGFSHLQNSKDSYAYQHSNHLDLNVMYQISRNLFANQNQFVTLSQHVAKHLFDCGNHPKIKDGDLICIYATDILFEDELVEGICIFKNEIKESVLSYDFLSEDDFYISVNEGIPSSKIDKSAIILNTFREDGYRLIVFDKSSNGNGDEAKYWKNDFLDVKPSNNDTIYTHQFIEMFKELSKEAFEQKDEQIKFVQKSFEVLSNQEQLDPVGFQQELLEEFPAIEPQMKRFNESVMIDFEGGTDFKVSKQALTNEKRKFKGIIKLDNQIEIKIMGGNNEIIKGYDAITGKHFYQIFFDEER